MSTQSGIICTLGPASSERDTILKMAQAGMKIARINFSHGTHQHHQTIIDTIRDINEKNFMKIKLLQDLEGYRIRIGLLTEPIELKKYQNVLMTNHPTASKDIIPLHFDYKLTGIHTGTDIFIDDGKIHLQVTEVSDEWLKLEVLQGGFLKSHKGINIPRARLKGNIMTEKDKRDIEFGIKNRFDYVAQSFVRNRSDILRVSKKIKPHLPKCRIIAKIENHQGLKNIDSIIDSSEGIMVARGDLGVSLPIYQIPMIQKDIIRRCNEKKKMDITATQMLESMTDHIRPTRAEVSDVANAILDGSDYVMLSGETAVGKYPVQTVQMMQQIINYTKKVGLRILKKKEKFPN